MKNLGYARADSTILEKLIVAYGLEETLNEIAHICDGNASHIADTWSDNSAAVSWIRKGNMIRATSRVVKEEVKAFALEEAKKRGKTFANELLIETAQRQYNKVEKERPRELLELGDMTQAEIAKLYNTSRGAIAKY